MQVDEQGYAQASFKYAIRWESHAVVTCTSSEFLDLSWKAFEDSTDFSIDVSLGCSDMPAHACSA